VDCRLNTKKHRCFFANCRGLLIFELEISVHGSRTTSGHSVHRGPAAAQTRGHWGVVAHWSKRGLRSLRGTGAHRRGWKRKRGTRGTHCEPHPGSGGGEVAAGTGLIGGGARAQREEEEGDGGCGGERWGSSPFIGVRGG
jgi:hypothetical protein